MMLCSPKADGIIGHDIFFERSDNFMPTSCTPAVERIARVLAGRHLSLNGEGQDPHASSAVDAAWRDHVEDAYAILHTLREPDALMAEAGDVAVWRNMIGAVLASRPNA
tara:strand:+ start:975 stop:1301 length:327 start_codon:yes stop_codon:yes gene_type:complete